MKRPRPATRSCGSDAGTRTITKNPQKRDQSPSTRPYRPGRYRQDIAPHSHGIEYPECFSIDEDNCQAVEVLSLDQKALVSCWECAWGNRVLPIVSDLHYTAERSPAINLRARHFFSDPLPTLPV